MTIRLLPWLLLLLLFAASALPAAEPVVAASPDRPPYRSLGFLTFPAEVKLGLMSAVAVDADDRIYVLHRGTPPLVALDKEGQFLRAWGEGLFKVPHGLRVDRAGNLWTTDNGNHVLRKFDASGKLLATLGVEGQAGAAPGEVVFRAPDDVVFDSRGNFYVADSGNARIVKLDPEGKFLAAWGQKGKADGQFATAHSLAIDSADRLYVGDRGNQRVQLFDTGGKHLATWTGMGNPFGLLVVGDELLTTEGDTHQVFHLDRQTGKVLTHWGSPKELELPHLMALDSRGILYIAEVNGKRVQRFEKGK
jgi:DNA-binding beta-propeller fold protein YncE